MAMPIDQELREQLRREMLLAGAQARRGWQDLPAADAVVILSAPSQGEEATPENIRRVEAGLAVWLALIKDQIARQEEGQFDWRWSVRLVLNGDSQQVHMLNRLAMARTSQRAHPGIVLVDAGPQTGPRAANTKTQLVAQGKLAWQSLVLVTSDYHLPRVARTASRYLPAGFRFRVIPVPDRANPGEGSGATLARAEAEVTKILRYAAAGEIDRDVPPERLF